MEEHKQSSLGVGSFSHHDGSPDMNKHSDHHDLGGAAMMQRPVDDPMKWPIWKKVYTSATAWCYTFTLLNSLTSYAAAVEPVTMIFKVPMQQAFLGFSLFLFGIMFAPLYTPHVSERIGRRFIYPVATVCMSAFLLGAAYSQTFTQLAICRFFAGLCGGPIVVNVEGTFADLWDANSTVTYYSFLAAAQYIGASLGPIICANVIPETSWKYSQFIPSMFAAASLIFGGMAPETYSRHLLRKEARRAGQPSHLSPAPSGQSIGQMIKITVVTPLMMIVSEPIVAMSALMLGINFGLLFSLFTAVPPVLKMTYMYTPHQLGLGFLSGLSGSVMALITAPILEQAFRPLHRKMKGTMSSGVEAVEYRLVPAILGSLLMVAGTFWVGYTASPKFKPTVPIAGTAVYVWGSLLVTISIVSYFFNAYPKDASILSALTAMACFRVFCGGFVSIYFLESIMKIGGPNAFTIFGSLMAAMTLWPTLLYFLGPRLRARSRYSEGAVEMMSHSSMGS